MAIFVKEYDWMWLPSGLNLSPAECRVYAYIYGLTESKCGKSKGYTGSVRQLARSLGLSLGTASTVLRSLQEEELISKQNGVYRSVQSVNSNVQSADESVQPLNDSVQSLNDSVQSLNENVQILNPHTPIYKEIKEKEEENETRHQRCRAQDTDEETRHQRCRALDTDDETRHQRCRAQDTDDETRHQRCRAQDTDEETRHQRCRAQDTDEETRHQRCRALDTDKEKTSQPLSSFDKLINACKAQNDTIVMSGDILSTSRSLWVQLPECKQQQLLQAVEEGTWNKSRLDWTISDFKFREPTNYNGRPLPQGNEFFLAYYNGQRGLFTRQDVEAFKMQDAEFFIRV